MTVLEQLEKDAVIEEVDIAAISGIIMQAIEVKGSVKKQAAINTKETILDSLADMLEKMLTSNLNLTKQNKVEIIHLLNKLKANEEYMQLVKGNLTDNEQSFTDMMVASERLGKKSQSAFELD
jgi:fructose-1-phosphate kinase PfkB-like protein